MYSDQDIELGAKIKVVIENYVKDLYPRYLIGHTTNMRFYLINEDQYPLKGTNGRFIHLATVGYGVREFIVMLDGWVGTLYVEEITGGSLIQVIDKELWKALIQWVKVRGLNRIEGNT
jgi:hypothetical protein